MGGGYLDKKDNLEFERLNKTKRKKLVIASILGLGIVIGGISIYRSYALYEEEQEYNVLKGQIPDFGYDVKVAIEVDGTKKEKVPERKADNNDNYYVVQVTCNNNTQGEWDYNAWNLKIDSITSDSKCNIAFASNLSKEEYQNYIDAGIAYRRNTYRGKDLTEFFTKEPEKFYKQISEGTFDDIYVGDYIVSEKVKENYTGNNNKVIWLVADIDNYLHTGETELTNHHLTMIPAVPLMKAQMNTTNTTKGGYYGSKMVSGCDGQYEGTVIKTNISSCQNNSILDQVYKDYIKPDFGDDHVLTYSNLLTNTVDNAKTNRYGTTNGGTSNWEWVTDRKLDLMSEMNVYGGTILSSSVYDTGIDNIQYAIFQLKPWFINSYGNTRFAFYLKDVSDEWGFAYVTEKRTSHSIYASAVPGVRPRFLIG